MHLSPAQPKEGTIYYIAKSFRNERGTSTKKNMFRLGTLAEIREREGVSDREFVTLGRKNNFRAGA